MANDRPAEERSRLYAAFEAASDGIAVFDIEGRLVMANLTFRKLFGLIPDGLAQGSPGSTVEFLTSRARAPEEFRRRLRGLLRNPDRMQRDIIELTLPYPRVLLRVSAPVRDERGRVVGQVHTYRDVAKEQEVARMKSEFVSTVSHELRTPLTSMKGSLQLILDSRDDLLPLQQELLNICLRNTDRLITLINDLLDLSKIEAGRLKLMLADQTVSHLVELALAAVRKTAEQHRTPIEVDLPLDLPLVHADRDRIVQVLSNLLDNAIKFSREGEPVMVTCRPVRGVEIDARGRADTPSPLALRLGDFLEISVIDRGRGIAPQDLQKLFTKFQQLDGSPTREAPGSGLGLAICKAVVEKHGGRIRVRSKGLGLGTTVSFILPQAGPPRPSILVADDDPQFVSLLVEILGMAGYSMTTAADGRAALERIQEIVPDLLILDLMLPEVDGWELLRVLRARESTRDVPILVVTVIDAAEAERTLALGANEYLGKPISPSVLTETVNRLVVQAERLRRKADDEVTERLALAFADPIRQVGEPRCRILVVEDNPVNQELMVELLAPGGFDVHTCSDGNEAIRLAKTHRPDLILLDINLPNVDGLTVTRILREDPETRDIGILAVSAYALVGDEERLIEAGCDGFIRKPIDTNTFLPTVSTWLEQGRMPTSSG